MPSVIFTLAVKFILSLVRYNVYSADNKQQHILSVNLMNIHRPKRLIIIQLVEEKQEIFTFIWNNGSLLAINTTAGGVKSFFMSALVETHCNTDIFVYVVMMISIQCVCFGKCWQIKVSTFSKVNLSQWYHFKRRRTTKHKKLSNGFH